MPIRQIRLMNPPRRPSSRSVTRRSYPSYAAPRKRRATAAKPAKPAKKVLKKVANRWMWGGRFVTAAKAAQIKRNRLAAKRRRSATPRRNPTAAPKKKVVKKKAATRKATPRRATVKKNPTSSRQSSRGRASASTWMPKAKKAKAKKKGKTVAQRKRPRVSKRTGINTSFRQSGPLRPGQVRSKHSGRIVDEARSKAAKRGWKNKKATKKRKPAKRKATRRSPAKTWQRKRVLRTPVKRRVKRTKKMRGVTRSGRPYRLRKPRVNLPTKYKGRRKSHRVKGVLRKSGKYSYSVVRSNPIAGLKTALKAGAPIYGGFLANRVLGALINKYVGPKLATNPTLLKLAPVLPSAVAFLSAIFVVPKVKAFKPDTVRALQMGATVALLDTLVTKFIVPKLPSAGLIGDIKTGLAGEYVPFGAYMADPTGYSLPHMNTGAISGYNVQQHLAEYVPGMSGMGVDVSEALAADEQHYLSSGGAGGIFQKTVLG